MSCGCHQIRWASAQSCRCGCRPNMRPLAWSAGTLRTARGPSPPRNGCTHSGVPKSSILDSRNSVVSMPGIPLSVPSANQWLVPAPIRIIEPVVGAHEEAAHDSYFSVRGCGGKVGGTGRARPDRSLLVPASTNVQPCRRSPGCRRGHRTGERDELSGTVAASMKKVPRARREIATYTPHEIRRVLRAADKVRNGTCGTSRSAACGEVRSRD